MEKLVRFGGLGGGVLGGWGRRAADEEETVEFTDGGFLLLGGGLVFYFIFMYFPMYNTRYLFVNKYSRVQYSRPDKSCFRVNKFELNRGPRARVIYSFKPELGGGGGGGGGGGQRKTFSLNFIFIFIFFV